MPRSLTAPLRPQAEPRRRDAVPDDGPVRPTSTRTSVPGPDPVRVLLLGGDLAVGHHARRREEALDGAIAALLHDRLDRGVVVQNRSTPGLPLAALADSLLGTDPAATDLVVWCPTAREVLRHPRPADWHRALTGLVRELRQDSRCGIVLLAPPAPRGRGPVAGAARVAAAVAGRTIRAVAADQQRVRAVAPPASARAVDTPARAAKASGDVARAVLPSLLLLLGPAASRPGVVPAPAASPAAVAIAG